MSAVDFMSTENCIPAACNFAINDLVLVVSQRLYQFSRKAAGLFKYV